MPRDGSNVYHRPSGTDGIPNTPVQSAPYNTYTADIEQDLNLPRPIVAGGTAATSADVALLNLSAEKAKQVVTNWDSMVWLAGSFYAATTASGAAPVAAHAFAGVVYYANATDFVLQAVDLTDANHPQFIRVMSGGVWGAWAADDASVYVKKAGDTMTGDLTINSAFLSLSAAAPSFNLTKAASGAASGILSRLGASLRWILLLGDTTAESGSNVGSDFVLQAYTDAAAPVTPPALTIKRALNRVLLAGDPVAALDAATKQYTDAGDVTAAANTVKYVAQTLTAPQKAQTRVNIAASLRGQLAGLILSTAGSSATFTVAAGEAADSTAADLMQLAASLAKTTAAWVVGAGGALDTGSIAAAAWYHVYLIKRPDTGVVDVCVSASAAAPTFGGAIPAAYTLFRRIGSMLTAASQWVAFVQKGDDFQWTTCPTDVNLATQSTTAVLYPLTVPPGVQVNANLRGAMAHATVGTAVLLSSPDETSVAATTANFTSIAAVANGLSPWGLMTIRTDTSRQIRAISSAATTTLRIATVGWTDRRGRDD